MPAEHGQRRSLGLKVTPDIKNRLDAAAKANGRSQSQEAEARLEQSFRDDRIEAKLDEILRAVKGGIVSPDEWPRGMGIPVLWQIS